jgi:hypothetical protein
LRRLAGLHRLLRHGGRHDRGGRRGGLGRSGVAQPFAAENRDRQHYGGYYNKTSHPTVHRNSILMTRQLSISAGGRESMSMLRSG